MKSRFAGVFAAVLFSIAGTAAFAQSTPTPAPTTAPVVLPTVPPNTNPVVQSIINAVIGTVAGQVKSSYGWEPNRARGVVTFYKRFDMQVRFANGTYRSVHLHQGTVINPRGYSIKEGDRVDIQGQGNSDGTLNANQITLQ